ncbi:MAG: COP23 domain-containing protein [Chamaesiphon sp.]|nr:COP23 domain-containing protein [Chamaesiphon sp.]
MLKRLKSIASICSLPIFCAGITLSLVSVFSVAPSQAAPAKADMTTFACVKQGEDYATVAKRANRTTPPIIIWKDKTFGKYTPQKRCDIVSKRLTQAVGKQSGRLKTLKLTHGSVGSSSVICFINHPDAKCDSKNILFTLKPEDKGQEAAIIEQLVSLKVTQQPLVRGVENGEKRAIAKLGCKLDEYFYPGTEQDQTCVDESEPVKAGDSSSPTPVTPINK